MVNAVGVKVVVSAKVTIGCWQFARYLKICRNCWSKGLYYRCCSTYHVFYLNLRLWYWEIHFEITDRIVVFFYILVLEFLIRCFDKNTDLKIFVEPRQSVWKKIKPQQNRNRTPKYNVTLYKLCEDSYINNQIISDTT